MTDKQLNDELIVVGASLRLQQCLDQSTATALHSAAVMARNSWIETFNRFSEVTKDANGDALCREIAQQITALNEMVDRSAALKETK